MIHKQTESTNEGGSRNNIINKMLFRVRKSSLNTKLKTKQLKNYDIRKTIGDGSFGVVKKAVHLLTEQIVAVKICSVQNWSPSKLKLLQAEISRQRHIMHQNIAQVYQVVRTTSKVYIFMEYCKNAELFDRISKKGPIPQNEAARIFHQILSALLYLRQNNLSHRDIKPQNILFDQHWNAKLVDFGYVCFSTEDQFRTTVCGTTTYMAPEIIKRQPYDAELADVWSLGVTLYAMLTAKLPFDGENIENKMRNIVNLKYCPEPSLSFQAHKLIKSIFKQQSQRVRLQEILQSEFSRAYEIPAAKCIDFRSESINLELDILNTLQEEGIDIVKLRQSVLGCQLDKYRALYFLTLKKQKESGNYQRLSVFNKHKKYGKSKLSSILITKLQDIATTDNSEEKPLPCRISTFRHKLRIKQVRLHTQMMHSHNFSQRKNTIDSPPKLDFKLTER